jgi:hypothetical protein
LNKKRKESIILGKAPNSFKEDTMNAFFPSMLLTYLEPFRQLFSSPSYSYFKAYIWGMLIIDGRKCITKIGHACFFLDRHIAMSGRRLRKNQKL